MRQVDGRTHVKFILQPTWWLASLCLLNGFIPHSSQSELETFYEFKCVLGYGGIMRCEAVMISSSPVSAPCCCPWWCWCVSLLKHFLNLYLFWIRSAVNILCSSSGDFISVEWWWCTHMGRTGLVEQEFKWKLRIYVEYLTVLSQVNAF